MTVSISIDFGAFSFFSLKLSCSKNYFDINPFFMLLSDSEKSLHMSCVSIDLWILPKHWCISAKFFAISLFFQFYNSSLSKIVHELSKKKKILNMSTDIECKCNYREMYVL